jgi:RNA recognition motif-containing protein
LQFGEIKETRPVMKRNGVFRGYAYVEYKDEVWIGMV